ncbi:LexA family protein [Sphingomonas corticis]
MNGGGRGLGQPRNGGRATKCVDDAGRLRLHGERFALIANNAQPFSCDNRDCDIRKLTLHALMTPDDIRGELDRRNMSQRDLAQAVGMNEDHLSKALAGRRQFKLHEMDAIRAELAPEPGRDDHLPLRSIPLLGDVPAGSFQPQEQIGGKRLVVTDPEVPPNAYGLRIKGDSMDLIVPDGSTVIVDPDDKKLWPGFRYVVRTADGQTTFKEYQEGPARLVPCSSNPQHHEIELGAEPIVIEGRVWSYSMRDAPRRSI